VSPRNASDLPPPAAFGLDGLAALIAALRERGYRVIGPTVRDRAVVYDTIEGVDALPVGWRDVAGPAHYRLEQGAGAARFAYTLGPQAWKRHLHPPVLQLWRGRRGNGSGGVAVETGAREPTAPQAFLGVRACELAAIRVQDRVLRDGPVTDPEYAARRAATFIVAVQCTATVATCFCVSMGTGPAAGDGYDLALTEIVEGDTVRYVCAAGSRRGAEVLSAIPHDAATAGEQEGAAAAVQRAAEAMGRILNREGVAEALRGNPDHPRWDEVGARCLGCGNCTLVCPTCFCTTVEDVTDLGGAQLERRRLWDSCFTLDFSYIHGGSVRGSSRGRYRHWLTHKLSTWWDQFGVSGCVGCGRCIAWCPSGIDLTEEVRAIRASTLYRRRSLGDIHGQSRADSR
jgi:ferredoxin